MLAKCKHKNIAYSIDMKFEPYGCPVRFGAAVLGDRWCLMIIRDLMFKNRRYYRELLEAGEGISTNILADRLQRLEEAEIITKSSDPDHGKRYIYRLTEKGIALLPVMLALLRWAADYDDQTEMPQSFIKKLRSNMPALEKEIMAALQNVDDE